MGASRMETARAEIVEDIALAAPYGQASPATFAAAHTSTPPVPVPPCLSFLSSQAVFAAVAQGKREVIGPWEALSKWFLRGVCMAVGGNGGEQTRN